jgi:hypothetical protein
MKKTNVKLLLISGALALSAVASSSAQMAATGPASAANAPVADTNYGLLGSNYLSLDYGYLRDEQHPYPLVSHDYGAEFNHALTPGLDLNVNYDYLTGSYQGQSIWRNQATAGLTAYAPINSMLKPFVDGAVGWDWQHYADRFFTGGTSGLVGGPRDAQFTSILGAGVEIQVLHQLVISPFGDYQAIHNYGHDWNWGAKATYRLTPQLSVSLIPQVDEHNNLNYGAAVNYHF